MQKKTKHTPDGYYSVTPYLIVKDAAAAIEFYKKARKAGIKTAAEIQFNNTCEIASIPYLPVMDLVAEHLHNLAPAKLDGMLIGWTMGGHPSPNFQLAQRLNETPAPNIDAVLDVVDLGRYLQAVVSADEVGRGKPDPALFLESARRIGVLPPYCVVVEDAPAGVEAARRAGMRSIGVLSHHHRRLAASLVVPSLEELPPDAFMLLLST